MDIGLMGCNPAIVHQIGTRDPKNTLASSFRCYPRNGISSTNLSSKYPEESIHPALRLGDKV